MNIEKYLVLNKYLLSLFGVSDFRDLQEKLKDAPVGVDSDGRSYFINVLRSSFEGLKIPEDTLLRYDEKIQFHVRKINYKREPVSLKYFQYLAVLFVELVLDNLKNRRPEFLYELNEFLKNYKQEQDIEIIDSFTENDLKKACPLDGNGFWENLDYAHKLLSILPLQFILSRQYYFDYSQ